MKYFSLILWVLLLLNCKKEVNNVIDLGKDYYPLKLGYWQEYTVDSIIFSDFTDPISIDTAHYFLKENYESTYKDLDDKLNYRVEQFKKNDTSSWSINHIISVKANNFNVQRVENDLRFIKFIFPPKKDKTWEGNIYIDVIDEATLEYYNPQKYEWQYKITAIDEQLNIVNFTFDSCVTIIQIDNENLFEKKYSKEIYAKHVGLVYKELLILKTQAPPSNASFIERAENGFIIKQTILDYKH